MGRKNSTQAVPRAEKDINNKTMIGNSLRLLYNEAYFQNLKYLRFCGDKDESDHSDRSA